MGGGGCGAVAVESACGATQARLVALCVQQPPAWQTHMLCTQNVQAAQLSVFKQTQPKCVLQQRQDILPFPTRLLAQVGQEASQVAPKSAAKGKKSAAAAAAAALTDEAKSAMALVEAVAADLPQLDKDRWVVAAVPCCAALWTPQDEMCSACST